MTTSTYAIISDVHANLPALEAVLRDIATRAPTAVYHLGDLVGYAPWPNESVEVLRTAGIQGVAGNYDSTIAHSYKHCGCRADMPRDEELAHLSYEWTGNAVTPSTRAWLQSLPFRIDVRPAGGHVAGRSLTLFHATPRNNLVYVTEDRTEQFLQTMARQAGAKAGDLLCFGHTHKPWHRVIEGIHFVNTGSVGRPKDGDPRACYALIAVAESVATVEFVRVVYDIERTARGIIDGGLPVEFADHLRTGGQKI